MAATRLLSAALLSCALARASFDATPDDAAAAGGLARGWGESLPWTPYSDAFALAQSSGKPIVLLVWKSWCGACKALRPRFAESSAIAAHADAFVFVNVVDDEEPQEDRFKPDGGYIPRVLFIDGRSGQVMDDVVNAGGNPKYKVRHGPSGRCAWARAHTRARALAFALMRSPPTRSLYRLPSAVLSLRSGKHCGRDVHRAGALCGRPLIKP